MKRLSFDIEDVVSISSCSSDSKSNSTAATPKCKVMVNYPKPDFSRTLGCSPRADELIAEMLVELSSTINQEFNLKARTSGEHLFHLPDLKQESSLMDRLGLVKDLVSKVCQGFLDELEQTRDRLHGREYEGILGSPVVPGGCRCSLEQTEDTIVHPMTQVFLRPKPIKSKSVLLSQEDCRILCGMLDKPNSKTKPASAISKLQVKYKETGEKLMDSQAQLRKKEDEIEHLIDTNMRLRTSCKIMKQQIGSLERQLVDCMEETYKLEESYQRAMAELTSYKAFNYFDTLYEGAPTKSRYSNRDAADTTLTRSRMLARD